MGILRYSSSFNQNKIKFLIKYIDTKIDERTFFRISIYSSSEITIELWDFEETLESSIKVGNPYKHVSEKLVQNIIENNTDKIIDYSLSLLSDLLNVPYFDLKEDFKCFKREC